MTGLRMASRAIAGRTNESAELMRKWKHKNDFRVSACGARASAAPSRTAGWLRLFGAAAVALAPLTASAQALSDQRSTPQQAVQPQLPPEASGDVPVPDWMAWRAFYHRIEHYQQEAPALVPGLLAVEAGLSATDANIVLAAGYAYLDELELIDAQARSEISNRFWPRDLPRWVPPSGGPNRISDVSTSDLVPAHAPDGRLVTDVLAEEGFFDRLEQRRNSVFRTHWESLAESIGLYGLLWLERYIEEEVAPNIGFGGRVPVSPMRVPDFDNRMPPR